MSLAPAAVNPATSTSMVRCQCGKALGERLGAKLFIRRVGIVVRGGLVDWVCDRCGARQTIDLDASACAGAQ